MSEWISVKDRLPEIHEGHTSETVLVYGSDGSMAFSELEENGFGGVVFSVERPDPRGCDWDMEVTHWMPLPEPPIGVNGP